MLEWDSSLWVCCNLVSHIVILIANTRGWSCPILQKKRISSEWKTDCKTLSVFVWCMSSSCFSLQMIMNDGNAEKLCGLYEPHVCLTRDALFRLLDNHGPDFGDQWELPVTVKLSATKGMSALLNMAKATQSTTIILGNCYCLVGT